MKKVAIVGVEGSGKTVLMAAMGEKYRKPGADGLFLYANSRKTIEYCNSQIDILRNQRKWPDSTSPDALVNLEWTLMRRKEGSRPEEFCTVSFLDFAGEIYRYAFGDSTDDSDQIKQSQYKRQIEAVKSHLKDAESIVVLVNLSDIINSRGASKKASEMEWLSQRIFTFAFSETSARKVAIAFTQKDLYESMIVACGGLVGAFEEYLPSVFYRHESEIVPFAISAVNKTVPGDDGKSMPAPDFDSDGFDELMSWMADVSHVGLTNNERKSVADKTEEFMQAWRDERYDDAARLMSDVSLTDDVMYAIATMYEHGWGVSQNPAEALSLYQKVVERGGHGKWMTMASEAVNRITRVKIVVSGNNADSMPKHKECKSAEGVTSKFLRLCRKGHYKDAAQLIELVDKNVLEVQCALGDMYWWGAGLPQDQEASVSWYLKAAESGNAYAQKQLGYAPLVSMKVLWWRVKAKFYDWAYFDAYVAKELLKKFLIYGLPAIIGVLIVGTILFAWFNS